jgi:hypothetical protein
LNRTALLSAVSLVVGVAAAAAFRWSANAGDLSVPEPSRSEMVVADRSAPLEARMVALEQALVVERQARQLLQEEILVLYETVERLSPESRQTTTADEADVRRATRRDRGDADGRTERLLEAGFTPAEAERILRRESELQMEALQARYEARRAGEPGGFGFRGRAVAETLRAELGDYAYERYLEANGRPTRVAISTVFESSPALAAGLRPGDEIVSYDGRRVFSMDEIVALTMEGAAGENVVVDIARDGIPMQVAIPRGPLGVTGGRRFRR